MLMLTKANFLILVNNARQVSVESDEWDTYDFFKSMFTHKKRITKKEIILVVSVAYSWMPTMLGMKKAYNSIQMNQAAFIVNRLQSIKTIKNLEYYEDLESDLNTLVSIINNSIVGVSKMLHLFSDYAPIIDSRVIRSWNHFFRDDKNMKIKNNTVGYIRYWQYMLLWRNEINRNRKRKVSLRDIEKLLYLTGEKK